MTGRERLEERDWPGAGRKLLHSELTQRRGDIEDALWNITDDLLAGEDPDAADIRAARTALDEARRVIEESAAAVTDGVEPWGDGVNKQVPGWVVRENYSDTGAVCDAEDDQ